MRYYLNGMLFESVATACVPWRPTVTGWPPAAARWWNRCPIIRSSCRAKGCWNWCACWKRKTSRSRPASGHQQCRAALDDFIFTSKLVDGRFPDWRRVIPRSDKALIAGRGICARPLPVPPSSPTKFRGVRLNLQENLLRITANNPEQEEAEELLDVQYAAGEMEIGFNVSYVLDVLNTLNGDKSGSA